MFRRGRPILDRCVGLARQKPDVPVTEDTLFLILSASKPFASICIFKLIELGRLALSDRVADHWPEFARHGKGSVTIEHVLTHRAGIPVGPGWLRWDRPADAETTARAMEDLTPQWPPGEGVGYHPVNYGWMIREIVRRVAGKPIGRFLRDGILEPLGIRDAYLGLPPELEERVAHHYLMPGYTPQKGGLAGDVVEEAGIRTVAALNRLEIHQAEVPAAGIIATAREVARFYVMLLAGGELEGVRVLRRESVEKATSLAVEANPDRTLGVPVRWAYGFHLGATTPALFGRASRLRAFGHSGASCTVAWADPETDLALAYLRNGERDFPSNLQRFMDMADAVRHACR